MKPEHTNQTQFARTLPGLACTLHARFHPAFVRAFNPYMQRETTFEVHFPNQWTPTQKREWSQRRVPVNGTWIVLRDCFLFFMGDIESAGDK